MTLVLISPRNLKSDISLEYWQHSSWIKKAPDQTSYERTIEMIGDSVQSYVDLPAITMISVLAFVEMDSASRIAWKHKF
jgi:hypothetical protein